MANENIEAIYPLTPLQQGILYQSLSTPEAGTYVVQHCYTLQGLNTSVFKQAWQQVVAQHAILRTAFFWERNDEPLQIVGRHVQLTWEEQDWRDHSEQTEPQDLAYFLEQDRQRDISLTHAPLMHFSLLHLSDERLHFVWSFHHLLLDGWSWPLILNDLWQSYEALLHGHEPALVSPRPYKDYILWLQQQDLQQAEHFWRTLLAGFTTPTPLGSHPLTLSQHPVYQDQRLVLSTETTRNVQMLARQHKLTLNTLLQGAWALVLSRWSGQQDVVFGAVVSGRPPELPGVETMVGMFINTLPVRIDCAPDSLLLPWLSRLQEQQLEARLYEFCSLTQIQGWSSVSREFPLFQHIFVFENYPTHTNISHSFQIENVRYKDQSHYPLTAIVGVDKQLILQISYQDSRFDDVTINRMLSHWKNALEAIIADPTQRVVDVPLLTAEETEKLVNTWNATRMSYDHRCMHQLFEEKAEQAPDVIALTFQEQQLTYRELNQHANQLAHYLQSQGVKADVCVGLSMERSPEMIIGLLGILKAGGTYLPIDPGYPEQRISYMIEETQLTCIVTQPQLAGRFHQYPCSLLLINTEWEQIECESTENLVFNSSHAPAYIIYTSGSTGKPKGVQLEHEGLTNMVQAQIHTFGLRRDDRILQFSSISFDASIAEISACLLAGATLCLERQETLIPSQTLIEYMHEFAITVVTLPPSVLAVLPEEQITTLRIIITAGEACTATIQRQWAKGRTFFNAYGPTEATVCATIAECRDREAPPSIGGPITNLQVYLFNEYMQQLPIGVVGEIYIGGAGLARGYLNRPDLTAERFVPHPFSQQPGARLYRTGDLARYREDGDLEYLGRNDQQVKIRGFRIELGEIEAALQGLPQVQEATVMVREDRAESKQLVAYLLAQTQQGLSNDQLRQHLRLSLPDYMLPSMFIVLPAFPLTINGKLDRQALPAPSDVQEPEDDQALPRNDVERALIDIWKSVLHVESIGINTNFFDVGGHSLLMIRVQHEIRKILHINVPIVDLFKHPTISALASSLTQEKKETNFTEAVQRRLNARRRSTSRENVQQEKKEV